MHKVSGQRSTDTHVEMIKVAAGGGDAGDAKYTSVFNWRKMSHENNSCLSCASHVQDSHVIKAASAFFSHPSIALLNREVAYADAH